VLAITAAHGQEQSLQYYRKREMCDGQR